MQISSGENSGRVESQTEKNSYYEIKFSLIIVLVTHHRVFG